MYDDEFELTFDLSDEDEASRAPAPEQEPVQEAAPEPAAETEPPVEAVPEPAAPAANGRCVLISGGDRGIGAAAARAFWQAGYRVAVLYHTHAEAAAALERRCRACWRSSATWPPAPAVRWRSTPWSRPWAMWMCW